jgi:hypothetical protein
VRTSRGEEKVIANDIFRGRVTLRGMVDGELRTIPIAELLSEMITAGDPLAGSLESASREVEREPAHDEMDEPMTLEAAVTEEFPVQMARPQRAPQPAPPTRPAPPPRPPRTPAPAVPVAAAAALEAPDGETDSTPASDTGTEGEKRGQRRRGRRGGRRNRPGGGGAPPAPGTPPAGPASNGA